MNLKNRIYPFGGFTAAVAAAFLAAFLSGCSAGPGEAESKMTSYSAAESSAESADLFTVPTDQMSHVKVVAVEKTSLPRVLRLTGAVAYNAFMTTPVFAAI